MPLTTAEQNNSIAIIQLLQLAEKAISGGPKTGPGSRGGKFYRDANGKIHYGEPPKGKGQKPAAANAASKPKPAAINNDRQTLAKQRMVTQISQLIKSGKDAHGMPLSLADRDKLELLSMSIRADLRKNSKKEVADDPVHTGVMVAFYVDTFSPDAAVKLQIPGGETWDALHLTLAFLGDSTEMLPGTEEALYRAISGFCADRGPLEGEISGVGLFNAAEGEAKPFYASFDSPGLPSFRAQLIEMLQVNGIEPLQNHGFTPHITLAYLPKGLPLPNVELPQMPVIFSKVTVKWGDRRTDFSLGRVTKEVNQEIAEKAADRLPFTVFKDKQGQWRWIGIASSAAQDHDGETVSLKALAEDVANKDATGTHGPLNWWHTSIKLGTCDFNAMDGPLLVESGTFVSDRVAAAVSKAISDGVFKPAMSLEFEHNEPGPPVLPGRVFQRINKVGRALLPAEKASNLLTSFKVYSLKSAALADEKESKKMLTDEKRKKALEVFSPELLEALEGDNQVAVKMAEAMNLSFKAMSPAVVEAPAPAPAPVEVAPVVVAPVQPEPAPVVNEVAAPAPVEEVEEGSEGEAVDAAALFEGLSQSVADRVLAGIAASQPAQATASKEVSDALTANTIAMKEVATALATVQAENVSLKARLDALEGNQPPAVRARASQGLGIKEADLPPAFQELVKTEKENKDPYLTGAASLTGQPIHPGLMVSPARMGG